MKLTTSLIMFAALATSAFATSVSFNLATDISVVNAPAGLLLDNTYTLYVGTYTGNPATLASSTTYATINASFTAIPSGSIAFATGGAAGYNGWAAINSSAFVNDALYGGKPLYAWISNGSNLNAVLTGFGNIPNNGDVPNSLDAGIDLTGIAGLTKVLGTYSAAGTNLNAPGSGVIVLNNAVPEPSAALLGALGVLGLLRRRRN